MKRTYKIFIMLLVFIGVVAAGCVAQDSNMELTQESSPRLAPDMMFDVEFAADSFDGSQGFEASSKIIMTADMSLEVEDAALAVENISKIAQESGGFVSSSSVYDISYNGNSRKEGTITIRVPSSGFDSILDDVETLGTLRSKTTSGRDVTEEYIDLSTRLSNLEKQEKRLLEVLDMAVTVDEILSVEKELERVRGEIESLTGRLNYLEDRVEFSTITVRVTEPSPISQSFGLRDALSESVRGFISSVNALIVFIGYALPIVIFVTVIGGIIILIKRKVRA